MVYTLYFSDLFPLYIEFADSLAGKSSIALLNVCHPSKNYIAKIRLFSEIVKNLHYYFLAGYIVDDIWEFQDSFCVLFIDFS